MLSTQEVANQCGVTTAAVRRWITHGASGLRLPATRMGGTWRVSADSLRDWLADLTAKATGGSIEQRKRGRPKKSRGQEDLEAFRAFRRQHHEANRTPTAAT